MAIYKSKQAKKQKNKITEDISNNRVTHDEMSNENNLIPKNPKLLSS
jgi:hypothetical protein